MAQITMKFRGTNRVRNSLRRLASLNTEVIEPVMGKWAQDVRRKLKSTPYPPKRSGQTYRRTGQLANRWQVEKKSPSIFEIVNRARRKGRFYVGFVVGEEQAWMHKNRKNRWWKAGDVVRSETPTLVKKLTQKIEDIWRG